MADGVRIGVVGASTLVGKEIVDVIRERSLMIRDLVLLSTDLDDEGSLAEGIAEPTFIKLLNNDELESLDIVIFCESASATRAWIELRQELDFTAIDATDRDMAVNGPRVLIGVSSVDGGESLAVSPHPVSAAAGLVLSALKPLDGLGSYRLSVTLPASEQGQKGIDEMYQQTVAVLNAQSTPREVFEQQVAFNLYSPSHGRLLEREIQQEILDLTGFDGSVIVQQGAIFHSHTMTMFIETSEEIELEGAKALLEDSGEVSVREPEEYAGTNDAGNIDEIVVGRLSTAPGTPGDLLIQFFSDNLRRSRAINAVMIIEQLLEESTTTN